MSVEVIGGDLGRMLRMTCVVGVDGSNCRDGLVGRRGAEQPSARRHGRAPSGVLDDGRAAGSEVTLRAIAEPARSPRHIGMLRYAELGTRLLNEVAVVPQRPRDAHRVDRAPAVLTEQPLRPVDGKLEAL